MSANFAKLRVKYFTKTLRNPETADGTNPPINAEIIQNFNSAVIDNAQEWVIAVERFELNLNAIPFYDGQAGDVISVVGIAAPYIGQAYDVDINFIAYSLPHFIELLNDQWQADATAPIGPVAVYLTNDGFIQLTHGTMASLSITLTARINRVLGLHQSEFDTPAGLWQSRNPRWDTGDLLQHIRITSNLGLTSDTIGQTRSNVLTDLAVIKDLSASNGEGQQQNAATKTFSYSQRQKIQYDPRQRRYINILYPQPIINLQISAYYVYTDENNIEQQKPVQLEEGMEFSIKLGFYKRI